MGVDWPHHKGDLSAVSSSKKKNFKIDFLQTSAGYKYNGCISWYYISRPLINISTKCAQWIAIIALFISTENFIGLFLLHSKYADVIQHWSIVMPEENVRTVLLKSSELKKPKWENKRRHKSRFRLDFHRGGTLMDTRQLNSASAQWFSTLWKSYKDIFHCSTSSGASKWASERMSERSGVREQSKQCGAIEWMSLAS